MAFQHFFQTAHGFFRLGLHPPPHYQAVQQLEKQTGGRIDKFTLEKGATLLGSEPITDGSTAFPAHNLTVNNPTPGRLVFASGPDGAAFASGYLKLFDTLFPDLHRTAGHAAYS